MSTDSGLPKCSEGLREIEVFIFPEVPHTATEGWLGGQGASEAEMSRRFAEIFPTGSSVRGLKTSGEPVSAGEAGGWEARASAGGSTFDMQGGSEDKDQIERLAAEWRNAEERGIVQGVELGLARGREESSQQIEAALRKAHVQVGELLASFSESKLHYFHQLEQEAVRLALAIAARVLRREAQMDPLLLTGAVRVALGQLSDSTAVRLRVPLQEQRMWEQALALIPERAMRPEVVGEPQMKSGECRMETALGTADLSLWSQLKEIERGFFDRVGERGQESAESEHGSAESGGKSAAAGSGQ